MRKGAGFANMKGQPVNKVLAVVSGLLLLASLPLPWWQFKVVAPQYPKGLKVRVYVNRLEGDIREISLLNHYIGMKSLDSAAEIERKMAIPGILLTALLVFAVAFVPFRIGFLLSLPALLLPFAFAGDLFFWLLHYGTHLDPEAPIRLQPFIPKIIGTGKVAQFQTFASFQIGFYLALIAAALVAASHFISIIRFRREATERELIGVALAALVLLLTTADKGICVDGAWDKGQGTWVVSSGGMTLAQALSLAKDGDVILVKGGVHKGPFVVGKSVHLLGENRPILDGCGKGTVLTIKAPRVVVSGFLIRNSGDILSREDAGIAVEAHHCRIENNRLEDVLFGIVLRHATESLVLNNTLHGKDLPPPRRGDLIKVWYSDGVVIEANKVVGGRDVVLWFSKRLTVRGNEISQNRYGIHFMYCDDAKVESNRLTQNAVGIYLMYSQRLRLQRNWLVSNRGPSGYGIGLKDMDEAFVSENFIADNRVGIFAEGAISSRFVGNMLAHNDIGFFLFTSSHSNLMAQNSFVENGEQVHVEGTIPIHANLWQRNFWSDYAGYDADGDGLGDLPYKSVRLFERLTDYLSSLKFFSFSPASQAIEFASRCFPVFAPQPKLVDESPLMRPIFPPVELPDTPAKSPHLLLLSPLMVLTAIFFLTGGRIANRVHYKGRTVCLPTFTLVQQNAISVKGLTKRFGEFVAVNAVSFNVQQGEAVALWGPNGAGKTTILRCILGLYRFDGEIKVLGHDALKAGKEVRRLIGYLPQEIRLDGDWTVVETLNFYAKLRQVGNQRVEELLDEWNLRGIADKPVGELSGGMRQRLAFALALLSDPPILLLDEPTANLDARTRKEVWSFVSQIKRQGKTIVFCSHRPDEVRQLADYVLVLDKGIIVAEGKPNELADLLQEKVTLKLKVAEEQRFAAKETLQRHSFVASLNGSQLLVTAPNERKALPIQVLVAEGITVHDFDLSEGDHVCGEVGQSW
jgi:nitrous oxidase accessory protein